MGAMPFHAQKCTAVKKSNERGSVLMHRSRRGRPTWNERKTTFARDLTNERLERLCVTL